MSMNHPTTHHPQLQTLLATHAHVLRPLLGHLWPVTPFKVQQFGPLTKYTLGQMPDGTWAMLHHVTQPDVGAPHSHPCRFHSYRIKGSYWERLFVKGRTQDVLREEGSNHVIEPNCIHSLTSLPEGDCWTLCFSGPVVRRWRHYPKLLAAA